MPPFWFQSNILPPGQSELIETYQSAKEDTQHIGYRISKIKKKQIHLNFKTTKSKTEIKEDRGTLDILEKGKRMYKSGYF